VGRSARARDQTRGCFLSGRRAAGRGVRAGPSARARPEPENEHDPNAVAVWDAERRLQAGYVPAEVAPDLQGDEQAVSLWEFRGEDGQRIGLRVLLAPAEAWIQVPRS